MNRIAYYLFVLPLSYFPLYLLYGLSPIIYFICYYVISYRKNIVRLNIQHSFPEKTAKEHEFIIQAFYLHLSQVIIEGIKNLTISKKELSKRFKITNPEVVNDLLKVQKSVILVGGHCGNWEWLITSQAFQFDGKAFGLGMPMSNKFWGQAINNKRERFGLKVIHSKNYKEALAAEKNPYTLLMLGDQSPGDTNKSYWMNFLNQQTAVQFGTEALANTYDLAVVYFNIDKVHYGRYEMTLTLLTDSPKELKWGAITQQHTELLEQQIRKKPYLWMWSHKRWKRELPEDLDSLKIEQEQRFNEQFR
ncbi:MAG: lysophospholipid acyltransferase family protein [Crocinitomicaceae bacterium]|nr:lysophospholipid acyltransferase family protein [Crocinitomicaceae bacterium]